jgi:hypothetical protein
LACAHPVPGAASGSGSCPRSSLSALGVCLDDEEARAYCGVAARPALGGCTPITCDDAEPVDLATGDCIPALALRKLAGGGREDARVGCAADEAGLVAEGESVACLPRRVTCGRGARWTGAACEADPVCPPGAIADESGGCTAVVHGDGSDRTLDVGGWIRLVVGPDGGNGSSAVCGPLAPRPWLVPVSSHAVATVEVEVDLIFPDNAVSDARATVKARKRLDPHNTEPGGAIVVAKYMEPLWKSLRRFGGVANASSATVTVRCEVSGGADITHTHGPKTDAAPSNAKPKSAS